MLLNIKYCPCWFELTITSTKFKVPIELEWTKLWYHLSCKRHGMLGFFWLYMTHGPIKENQIKQILKVTKSEKLFFSQFLSYSILNRNKVGSCWKILLVFCQRVISYDHLVTNFLQQFFFDICQWRVISYDH